MTVDIYSMFYNEEDLIPHYLKFYKDRLSDVTFHLFDNASTDNGAEIAWELDDVVIHKIDTGGEIRDDILLDFKNNAWKESKADWIIVCDIDEWVDIDPFYLNSGTSHFVSEGYDMVGGPDTIYGVRNPLYDKVNLFNRRLIKDINYSVGAHIAHPIKTGVKGSYRPKMYHMRYPSKEEYINRYQVLGSRLSQYNKDRGFAHQYQLSKEELEKIYEKVNKEKIKVR